MEENLKKSIIIGVIVIVVSVPFFLQRDFVAITALNRVSRMHGDSLIQQFYPIPEKFWLHRSDSIEKLEELSDKYKGVELDIIFFNKENNFDVSHNSNGRIDYPLNSFLKILADNEDKIWLDFKNLNTDNAAQSLNILDEMLNRNNINKNKVIVESHNYNALKHFRERGFYTSFYCPVDEKYLTTEEGRNLFVSLVSKVVDSGSVDAVSFPIAYYPLIKSANIKADLLTWDENKKWFAFYFYPDLQKVLADPQVKVILVKDPAKINR